MNDPSSSAEEPPSPATQEAPTDRIAALNVIFRTLYGANRDELLAEVPLAGLTLIGTGEIWRIEFGQIVKCYRPIQEASKIKGLMHAVLGAHGAWGNSCAARTGAKTHCKTRQSLRRRSLKRSRTHQQNCQPNWPCRRKSFWLNYICSQPAGRPARLRLPMIFLARLSDAVPSSKK